MPSIYDQHDKAFANVSAYAVVKGGDRVATISFKFPRDGAGRLYAYVHWLGVEMVRGHANGYGYDKRSAACSSAARKIERFPDKTAPVPFTHARNVFIDALTPDDGRTWDSRLHDAGFDVWQIV